mgnify:CR=1 FL=1
MLFRVTHSTCYTYSRPVFLEPHFLRMRPRQDPFQRLLRYELAVDPAPAGQSESLDANGNAVTQLWFNGEIGSVTITVSSETEALMSNPFDFLLPPEEALRLPMHYGSATAALMPCRERPIEMDSVVRFAAGIAEDAGGQSVNFLNILNTRIYEMLEQEVREEGPAHAADETLERKSGSCRDAAVLFNAACRAVGIAARFVSGYQEGDDEMDLRHLHAWSEVYLPGAGWRGYDPTHGLVVSDRHIVLAAAPEPDGAMPLTGSFRGTGATWEMAYELDIEVQAPG